MKKFIVLFTAMVVCLLASNVPVGSDENAIVETFEQQTQQKDECLLLARNCGNAAVSIQDKIERLREEIAKGRAVYTVEELNTLKHKLEEVNRTLDFLLDR